MDFFNVYPEITIEWIKTNLKAHKGGTNNIF